MWDFSSSQCRRACPSYATSNFPGQGLDQVLDKCSREPMCEVDGSTCVVRCQYAYSNEGSCNNAPACLWDSVSLICRKQCPLEQGSTSCTQNTMCIWLLTTTPATCALRCSMAYTTAANCSLNSNCEWDAASLVCRESCQSNQDAGNCSAVSLCQWVTPLNTNGIVSTAKCVRRCSAAWVTADSCSNDPLCIWNPQSGLCVATCAMQSVSSECSAVAAVCDWNNGLQLCSKRCDVAASTAATCNSISGCNWNSDTLNARNCAISPGLKTHAATTCFACGTPPQTCAPFSAAVLPPPQHAQATRNASSKSSTERKPALSSPLRGSQRSNPATPTQLVIRCGTPSRSSACNLAASE